MEKDIGYGRHGSVNELIPTPPRNESLRNAGLRFRNGLKTGKWTVCGACALRQKIHERKLADDMALVMMLMYRVDRGREKAGKFTNEGGFLKVESYLNSLSRIGKLTSKIRGDWHKLRRWGLIRRDTVLRGDGSKRTGYYRMTRKGRSFVRGKITVPKSIIEFRDTLIAFSHEQTDMTDALGERFDYRELMAARMDYDELMRILEDTKRKASRRGPPVGSQDWLDRFVWEDPDWARWISGRGEKR